MSFFDKISNKMWKRIALQLGQVFVLFLPIAQLTNIDFVVEQLGHFGVKGLVASVIAGYVVAWVKRSPLTRKELEVLEQEKHSNEESKNE